MKYKIKFKKKFILKHMLIIKYQKLQQKSLHLWTSYFSYIKKKRIHHA